MAGKEKVLICGDVNGKFKTVFARVESINKKNGPFSYLLCVGNFFGNNAKDWEPYANGSIEVPVPTYILGPNNEKHVSFYANADRGQLAPSVVYLGKRGVLNTISGMRIAYLSGVEGDKKEYTFTKEDIVQVRDSCIKGQPSYRGVDFLLTSPWPSDICNLDEKAVKNPPAGSSLLSWLAVQIKPRYHICGLEGFYYERSPYKNLDAGHGIHCTRFVALAGVGNAEKRKYMLALSVTPIDVMNVIELQQQTTDQTELPYAGAALSSRCGGGGTDDAHAQFFYDMSTSDGGGASGRKRRHDGSDKRQRPTFDQDKCWFCLASPEVEKHLVISIGTEVYLALAKGGLVPDHLLILPVAHHQSTSSVPSTVSDEIKQFKSALKKYFKSKRKAVVFFERNYKTSHLQIQVVPVPIGATEILKAEFEAGAEMENFNLDELPEQTDLQQIAPPGTPYFFVELPSGEKLFHRVRKNFPLQFGRDVLASEPVLNMEERADWRECKLTKEEEVEICQKFRKDYQPFDFTL
ncbi:CWF19-like protein 1 [Nilaparvata lugens]|uniref:CWF19-like protein 1 n=1 Tax=Nilaparvata lugens TaxID=108931 RepID=UPI00193E792A|nr:CWF19-like protein 1 [Nilaparvata lugens]